MGLQAVPPLTAAQVRVAARMTEKALQSTVESLALDLGLRHWHPYDSRRSSAGWPDSVFVGPHGILFRELKTAKGRVRREQQEWLAALEAAGADVAVWRPVDVMTHRVRDELIAVSRFRDRVSTRT